MFKDKMFKGKKNKKIHQLVGLIFLIGAVIAGILLVKESQDFRERASGGNCGWGRSCGFLEVLGSYSCTAEQGPIYCCPEGKEYTPRGCLGEVVEVVCNSSNCQSPKHCQNGKCIGRDGGVIYPKCENSTNCKTGNSCLQIYKRCVPDKFCKLMSCM